MKSRAAISAYRSVADRGQFIFRRALLIGPLSDAIFFFLSPLVALSVAFFVYRFTSLGTTRVHSLLPLTWDQLLVSVMNQAHLVLVFSRSHFNQSIFRRYPWRFTLIPIVAWVSMLLSPWVFTSLAVLGILWGEYHSSLQTFGFARIYEARATGNAHTGRLADMILCHAIYFVPIWLSPNLVRLVNPLGQFETLDPNGLASVPGWVLQHAPIFQWGVGLLASFAIYYYIRVYYREYGRGLPVSVPKILLLSSSLLVSTIAWTQLSLLRAVFVIQFVHCWQYFAIVWFTEKKNLTTRARAMTRRPALSARTVLFAGALVLICYGLFAIAAKELPPQNAALSLVIVISLCHLWYDGFIWSVRKLDV